MLVTQQALLIIARCKHMRLQESFLLFSNFLTTLAFINTQINASFARQVLECLTKIHSFDFHNKCKDITTLIAREVVPDMLLWTYKKTRTFFSTKWAKSFKASSGTFELYIFTYDILDIKTRAHFFFCILHSFSISLFTSVIAYA